MTTLLGILAFGIGPLGGAETLIIGILILVLFGSKNMHGLARAAARFRLNVHNGRREALDDSPKVKKP